MGKARYLEGEACLKGNDTHAAAISFKAAIRQYEEFSKGSELNKEDIVFYIYSIIRLGELHERDDSYSTAIIYYKTALNKLIKYEDCFEELHRKRLFITIVKLFAVVYPLQKIYDEELAYDGIIYAKKAIKLYQELDLNSKERMDHVCVYIALGEIYKAQNEYGLAIHFHMHAISLVTTWKNDGSELISKFDYEHCYIDFNSKLAELYDLKEKFDSPSSFDLVKSYKSEKPFSNALRIYENLVEFLEELDLPQYVILAQTYYKIAEQYSQFSNAYAQIYGEMVYKISQPWMKATDTEKEADLYYQVVDSLIVYYGFVSADFLTAAKQRYLELAFDYHSKRKTNQEYMLNEACEAIKQSVVLSKRARSYYNQSVAASNALLSTMPDAKLGSLKESCMLSLKRLVIAEKKTDLRWQEQVGSDVVKKLNEEKYLIDKVNVLNRHFSSKLSVTIKQKKFPTSVSDIHYIDSPDYFLLEEQVSLSRTMFQGRKLDIVGFYKEGTQKTDFQSESKGDSKSENGRFFRKNKEQSKVVSIAFRGNSGIETKRSEC